MARATVPEPAPIVAHRPQKIKVKLTKANNKYTVKSSHELPPRKLVEHYLDSKARAAIRPFDWLTNVNDLINNTMGQIKPKDWATAIAKATTKMVSQADIAEVELMAVEGGAFLSMGNAIFKLEAVEYRVTGGPAKALPALRAHALEDAKVEAKAIITAASEVAKGLTERAEKAHGDYMNKIEQLKSDHRQMQQEMDVFMPAWCRANNLPCRAIADGETVGGLRLQVGMVIQWKLKTFSWEYYRTGHKSRSVSIPAKLAPAVPILLWIRLPKTPTELLEVRTILMDSAFGCLPHISSHACMAIGDAPKSLNNYTNYVALKGSIERAMSDFNMSSPLVAVHSLNPAFHSFVPDELKPVIIDWRNTGSPTSNINSYKLIPEDAIDKAEPPAVFEAVNDRIFVNGESDPADGEDTAAE